MLSCINAGPPRPMQHVGLPGPAASHRAAPGGMPAPSPAAEPASAAPWHMPSGTLLLHTWCCKSAGDRYGGVIETCCTAILPARVIARTIQTCTMYSMVTHANLRMPSVYSRFHRTWVPCCSRRKCRPSGVCAGSHCSRGQGRGGEGSESKGGLCLDRAQDWGWPGASSHPSLKLFPFIIPALSSSPVGMPAGSLPVRSMSPGRRPHSTSNVRHKGTDLTVVVHLLVSMR